MIPREADRYGEIGISLLDRIMRYILVSIVIGMCLYAFVWTRMNGI